MDRNHIDPHKDKWLFVVRRGPISKSSELSFGRVKTFLYERLYDSISKHNLHESYQLLKILPKESTLDPYILFRFILILIESNRTELIKKNVLIYLESLLSKLDLGKPEIFVEFLAYFIRHNRIDDARELFAQRYRFMNYRIHRKLPFVDVNLRCYEFLLNYLEWSERIARIDVKLNFDVSIQGWIVNAIDCLKSTSSNHEYFVMCLVRVLIFYGYYKKAYLFVSEFQRNNPDNIGAQLLHLNLLDRLDLQSIPMKEEPMSQSQGTAMVCDTSDEDRNRNRLDDLGAINNFSLNMVDELFEPNKYPMEEDRRCIINNLRRLDLSRAEIMEQKHMHDNPIGIFRDLMDGMEVSNEIQNISRWTSLKEVIDEIFETNNEILITDARFLWQTRYKRFWRSIDFVTLAGDHLTVTGKELIERVLSMFESKLNRPIR